MSTNDELKNETANGTKPVLCDVLSDEHIEVMARKVALRYAYANEHSYDMYVKAIIEGMKLGRSVMSKNIA
jgi:hypothetical protein